MRKMIVLVILTVVSNMCAAQGRLSEFTVTGYGKVFYTVDMADIQFSVSVRDPNVQECKRKHDTIIKKLNEYLEGMRYPKEILSLESTILKRERGRTDDIKDDYYLAQSVYSMRTNRISELSSLQADIVEIGVDEIQFVKLFSSKQRELEDQARKKALEDAKSKAILTAKQLGWALCKPSKVSYTKSPWYGQPRGFGYRSARVSPASPVAASANFVDITVKVSFFYKIEDEIPKEDE